MTRHDSSRRPRRVDRSRALASASSGGGSARRNASTVVVVAMERDRRKKKTTKTTRTKETNERAREVTVVGEDVDVDVDALEGEGERDDSKGARATFAKLGVKTLTFEIDERRAREEEELDLEDDSDDDCGAYDGPYAVRCAAVGASGLERDVAFEAWRPKRGLDREEMREHYKGLFDEGLDNPFRANNIVLRGRGNGVDYVGKNFTHTKSGVGRAYEREHPSTARQMLGRLKPNPDGGDGAYVMELIPIAGGRVIDLEARLHKYNYTEHGESKYANFLEDPEMRKEMLAKQLEAFASDKRKRQVNKINAARRLDQESIASPLQMASHITTAMENMKSRNDLIIEAGKKRNIPAHNLEATEANLAYPVDNFPCFELFSKLRWKELLDDVKQDTAQSSQLYEPLTKSMSMTLVGGKSKAMNERAKLVMYGDALCKLHNIRTSRIFEAKPMKDEDGATPTKPKQPFLYTTESEVDPDLQYAIIQAFMEEDFSGNSRAYVMSKAAKDLLRLQILLVALRVHDWTLRLDIVTVQLRIDPKDMQSYTRQLGCKSASGGKIPSVKLDLQGKPLAAFLPEIRARAKRAKARE